MAAQCTHLNQIQIDNVTQKSAIFREPLAYVGNKQTR